MAIAILVGRDEAERKRFDWFIDEWKNVLLNLNPNLDIRTALSEINNYDDIDFIMTWRHPLGMLTKFPNLKCIASLGAGVDHVMSDPDLPKHIPIVRLVDPYMINDITQYVLVTVLHYIKRMDQWESNQQQSRWHREKPFSYSDKTIGILGLGTLGKKAAHALHNIGLNVIGWSNSEKEFFDIKNYVGKDQFIPFLSHTDVLVCMLPLTPETKNILNNDTFSQLKDHAYVINLGRGEHLVENDLIEALNSGKLSGACLDVFLTEPLPSEHPFWLHPKIRVTPHIASVTNPATAVHQVFDNYQRAMHGDKLLNQIDITKGY